MKVIKYIPLCDEEIEDVLKENIIHTRENPPETAYCKVEIKVLYHEKKFLHQRPIKN